MFQKLEEVSVEWLKKNHYDAYFFGLGFIQIKIDPRHRIHFYHPDIPAFVEQPHDHRYNFISTVLRGRLENRIWEMTHDLVPEAQTVWYEHASCKREDAGDDDGVPEPSMRYRATVQSVGSFTINEGSSYYISKDTFHTVHPDFSAGPCVTSITRTEPEKEFARIIHVDEAACPFSKVIANDTIWKIVADCLYKSERAR